MKYSKCSVPGCNSIRQDVKLHKFPKCEKRLKQWLDSIKCDTLRGLNVAELDRLQVCHKHFEQRFVTEKSGILGNAYPTLFSPEEISTGIPSRTLEDDEKSGPSVEHNYSRKRHFDHTYGQQEASTSVKGGGVASTYSIDSTLKPMSHNLSGATISYPVSSVLPHPVPDTIPLVHHKQGSEKKKKLVQTVESLTPKCKILYREYRKTKKLLNFTRRAKRALRFSNEHSFEKKIAEMNPIARKVLLMQVRLCAKEIKGRRFSLEEKLISLSIMKQSPKAYKFLQRIFILPSMTTLKKTIQKLNVEPGINTQIFESIKEEVDTWKNEKKYCSIIFDEMALEPGLTYTHRDQIIGLVDLQNKTDEFADHALVFMVKGAVYKWQQTIAYYFCKGATPASEMKNIINEIVSAVGNTGLIPVALISDQGTAFQSAIKSLREETRRLQILADENTDDTIKINGFNISVIADPPHLIKGIRNNFLTKEISFDGKRAKWMDIVDVYKTDCQHANTRLLHKLNDEHVIPEKVKKMKVKNCVRVFSKTMAGALNYTSEFSHYADGRTVSSTLANTAEVVSFLDDLFDSITQKFKMILLSGNTLPERQKQLNEKVIKASVDDFNKYKAEAAAYDVDKMFLIDLAAKGKNIDFILETFKSGDIVYITRALNKSKWIGEDEYANHINVDNLHHNIFPLMSVKMKKKVLSVLSAAVTTENRSIAFYEYCLKEKLINIAFKFLYNAPEKYKQDVILQKKSEALKYLQSNFEEVVANFIGNSFILARTLLETMDNEWRRGSLLMLLHNMYSLSNEKYLDLLEKYKQIENRREISGFGRRISKDIIKKHKRRVLSNPFLYLHLLRKSIVSSNSTVSDVKIYAVALLPDDAETFWNMNFYNKYQFILDIIPANEKFTFIKKIFLEKYPGKSFEMSKDFYSHNFYYMMTNEEKETWALNHINSTLEVLGNGNDYTWYKFVQFDKAFEEIKKYVLITSDADKRVDMVKVLIDSAKSQKEIEILLKYFHDRHMNEERHLKYRFLEKLTEKHKVLDFHEECWIPFEKLLYSLDVFDITHSRYNECNYRAMTLIYYILRDKTVPAVVKNTLTEYQIVDTVKKCSRDLEPEKLEKVFQFMLKFYHSSIEASASKDIGEKSDTSMAVDAWVHAYLEILLCQSKTKEEIPDIINKFLKMNWDSFKYHRLLKSENDEYSERNIVRLMKKDATLVINEFPLIKQFIENRYGRTNWLLQKLKLYFHNDIAQKYLQLLTDCLSNEDMHYRMAQVAVYGILILADESFKIEFVQKYVPTNPKIDHKNTPRGLLHIQQAICAYASVSRPPLPLSSVQQYITGDYVHSCLPIFNSYLMNLPLPASVSFVESLINKPVSIQKHGLRLAFKCFSTDNLKTLLTDIWKRTKNVSIRKILYKSLIDRVLKESDDEQSQQELFEVLKKLTLDIHQDDDDEIFKSFVNGSLPLSLRVQLLVAAWTTVKKLPDRCVNFERRTSIVNAMKSHVHFVPEVEIEIITDEHISYMLANRLLLSTAMRINELNELNKAKWDLTLAHLTNINNEEQLKKRTVIVKRVIEKCVEIMLETRPQESGESYINARPREDYVKSYQFCRDFIISLQNHSYECHKLASYSFINILNSSIYHQLQNSQLKSQELFSLSIQLRLSEISRNSIISASQELSANAEVGDKSVAFKRCLDRFSIRLHTLLIEYIANGKYFSSFHRQIDAYILDEIERVYNTLFDDGSLNWNDDDVIVAACGSLLKFDLHELRMIVLRILPVNYDCLDRPLYTAPCIKDYQVAIDQLKMVNNEEVRQFLHEKFVLHNPIV